MQARKGGKLKSRLNNTGKRSVCPSEEFIATMIPAVASRRNVTWSQIIAIAISFSLNHAAIRGKPTNDVLESPAVSFNPPSAGFESLFKEAYPRIYSHAQSQIRSGPSTGSNNPIFHFIWGI